jgi:hypothetical protein
MLVRYFRRPSRIEQLRSGTGGHLLEGFAKELSQGRYQWVAARKHIRAAETGRVPARTVTMQRLPWADTEPFAEAVSLSEAIGSAPQSAGSKRSGLTVSYYANALRLQLR